MNTREHDDRQLAATRRLSTTMARLLRELSREFDRRITTMLKQRGHPDISPSHQVVLSNMGLGRTRVTELAERARITQQAMGKTLRELEKLGYIERAVDDTDHRARAIRLTDRGMQLVMDAIDCFEAVRAEYADKVGPQELENLESQLRSVAGKLQLDYLPPTWAEDWSAPAP